MATPASVRPARPARCSAAARLIRWVVSRLSGFTEKETLRTWTVSLTIVSVTGLLLTLALAAVLPFAG
jgi:hypothetical protein